MNILQRPAEIDLFGINPVSVEVETEDPGEENQRVECVFKEMRGGTFEEVVRLDSDFIDKKAGFNISKLILLNYDLPDTAMITAQTFKVCTSIIKEYQVDLNEYFGDPAILQNTQTFTGYALLSGLADPRLYDFYGDYSVNHRFLTHQPREKLVNRDQPEFLYFPTFATHYHSLRVKLFFSTGEVEDVSFIPVGGNHNFQSTNGDIFLFSTGFGQLQLANHETADRFILKYELRVSFHSSEGGAEVASSEIMTYVIDYDERSWEDRYFLFLNSLGGMDTLCTRGKGILQSKLNRSSRKLSKGPDSLVSDHDEADDYVVATPELRVNTGWIDKSSRVWLEDLGLSKRVWQIDTQNSQFIPVQKAFTNIPIDKDDEPLQSIELTFKFAEKLAL